MPEPLPPPADASARRPVAALLVGAALVGSLLLGVLAAPMAAARFGGGVQDAATAAPADAAVLAHRTTRAKARAAQPGAAMGARSTPSAAATPGTGSSAEATSEPSAVADPSAPVPATPERTARNVPAAPPAGSGHGRRIVYDKALMTVWIVDADEHVVRRYPVVGRWDRPVKGTYHVYSKSTDSMNQHSKVTFKDMVRFAWGYRADVSIGFHTIPVYYEDHEGHRAGTRMHGVDQLGLPIAAGGCVRQSDEDADFLYRWSRIGDTVVVLPSP